MQTSRRAVDRGKIRIAISLLTACLLLATGWNRRGSCNDAIPSQSPDDRQHPGRLTPANQRPIRPRLPPQNSAADTEQSDANRLRDKLPVEWQIPSKRTFLMKTLGGRQLWGDVAVFRDWRIQKNVVTGHYRLLDGDDFRHASGTYEECRQILEEIKKQKRLPRMSGKAVILVHGIIRSSKSFGKMRSRLKEEGYHSFSFDYPSTRVTISESADYLHRVIESMDGIEEINFIVHSMGGLVVRAYLAEHGDERIRRMVMIGVPNLGASMANRVQGISLYKTIFGPAGRQLIRDSDGFIAKLPAPDFEFAIIAGTRGSKNGYNILIPGDDDGTVGVDSTRLPGAADFIAVRGLHSFLPGHELVIDYALRFVKEGRLRENGDPHPIPKPEPEPAAEPDDPQSTAAEPDAPGR